MIVYCSTKQEDLQEVWEKMRIFMQKEATKSSLFEEIRRESYDRLPPSEAIIVHLLRKSNRTYGRFSEPRGGVCKARAP